MRKGTSQGRSIVCDPSGRSDVCCFARSVLSEHRENRSIPAENIRERDPLSPADEENLVSEENESANSSHQGTDKVLADILSAMTQMSATNVSMENAMKRLAGAPEDHATAPKRRRKPPATSAMSDSQVSDPEKSVPRNSISRPTATRQNWAALSQRTHCSMKLLKTLSAYHLNGIFGSFFWTNGTARFFPLRKQNRLNRII